MSVGYDSGITDAVPPYGSVTSQTLGTVGTLDAFYAAPDGSGNTEIVLIVTGASSAPAKAAITSVSYTGGRGAETLATSASSYSASGNTATWVWDNEPASSYTPDFNAGVDYALSFTLPSNLSTNPESLPVRGIHEMQGVVYVVVGATLYTVNSAGTLTEVGTGILGTGFVRMADNTECLTILIPGTAIAYTYTIPTTFAASIAPAGIDSSDARGRQGYGNNSLGAAVSPTLINTFGTLTGVSTTFPGTIEAFYWRFNGAQTQTVLAINSGTLTPPPQNTFVSVGYTDADGNAILLESAAATYASSGQTAIWTWITTSATPAEGRMTDSFVVTAAQDTNNTTRFGYCSSSNGSLASPSNATTFGSVAANTMFGTVEGAFWYYNSVSAETTIQLIVKGASAAPAQASFNALQYTDANGVGVYLTSASATYTAGSGAGADYAAWTWTITGDAAGTMTATDTYLWSLTIPTVSFALSLPSPNGFQQLTAPGFTAYGAIDVWYNQGYTCFLMNSGRGFFNDDGVASSGIGQITFNLGNVFGRENGTDLFIGGCVDHLEVMLLGKLSSEGYLNAGIAPGDPFASAPSSFMEHGCHPDCAYTIAKQDQSFFWVANDKTVRRRNGQTPQRVSNSGVEAFLEDADLTGCYALTPSVAGHPWWVLVVPNESRTFAYDCLTQQWWEPISLATGGSWRPLCWANVFGLQMVGDSLQSLLGTLDTHVFQEYGQPLFMEFTTQAIYSNNDRFTTRRVELVVTTGKTITQEFQPRITLYVSDDSGETYYAREDDFLGVIGERVIRCFWTNLGQSRCRVFKWRISDPTPTVVVQATGVFEGGRW